MRSPLSFRLQRLIKAALSAVSSFAFCLFTLALLKVFLVGVNLFESVDDEARLLGLVLVGLAFERGTRHIRVHGVAEERDEDGGRQLQQRLLRDGAHSGVR